MKAVLLYGIVVFAITVAGLSIFTLVWKRRLIVSKFKQQLQAPTKAIFVWLFFIGLLLPFVYLVFGHREKGSTIMENRNLVPFPNFAALPFERWPASFAGFLADHTAYRKWLVPRYFLLCEWYLHSPVKFALRGKNNHLFSIRLINERLFESSQEKEELYKFRAFAVGFNNYCKKRNIFFLLAFPPDKEKMLPEYMPAWIADNERQFRLERVGAMLDARDVPYVPLHTLMKNANTPKMYNKMHDLYHWNSLGIHEFYQVTAKRLELELGPGYAPVPMEGNYELFEEIEASPFKIDDDVTRMRLLRTEDLTASFYPGIGKGGPPPPYPVTNLIEARRAPARIHNAAVPAGRMVVIGDSYIIDESVPHLPFKEKWDTPALPFIYNVRDMVHLYTYDCTPKVMDKLCSEFLPEAIVLVKCERAITFLTDIGWALAGERDLGTLRLELFDAIASLETPALDGISITASGDESEELSFHVSDKTAFLHLPPITTDAEGYAVVGGNIVAPKTGDLELACIDDAGKRMVLRSPVEKGKASLLYFQLFGKPNTSYSLEFRPGMTGDFRLSPVTYY